MYWIGLVFTKITSNKHKESSRFWLNSNWMSLKTSRPPIASYNINHNHSNQQQNVSAPSVGLLAASHATNGRGSRGSAKSSRSSGQRKSQALSMTCDELIEVKSKFDAEFRRFSISRFNNVHDVDSFRLGLFETWLHMYIMGIGGERGY